MVEVGLEAASRRQQFEEYRRRIDVRQVLEHYGAQRCTEQPGSDVSTEVLHSCLLDLVDRHHANGDASPSACMNIERKTYVCYSSGWGGGILAFIAKMEGDEDLLAALPKASRFLIGSTLDRDAFVRNIRAILERDLAVVAEPPPFYSERVLAPWAAPHPYLTEVRGLSTEALADLRIGWDQQENRVVFPHFFDGKLLGWQKRAIPPGPTWPGTENPHPKYRSSSGMPKSTTLYGYDLVEPDRPLIVVESPASVAMARTLGIANVVATFGAKTSGAQVDLMRKFPEVYLWYDDDRAGYDGAASVSRRLWRSSSVYAVVPDRGSDLADYRDAEEVVRKVARDRRAVCLLGPDWRYDRRHG